MRLTCILVVLQHHWNYINDVHPKSKGKEFKATFEHKTKALYDKLPFAFDMMSEILTESCLDDTKRMKEILAMLKSRLLMKFQSSGHTTAALRALSFMHLRQRNLKI